MPLAWFTVSGDFIIVRGGKVIRREHIHRLVDHIRATGSEPTGKLLDLRDSRIELDSEDLDALSQGLFGNEKGGGRVAALFSDASLDVLLVLKGRLPTGSPFRLFREEDPARDWLNRFDNTAYASPSHSIPPPS